MKSKNARRSENIETSARYSVWAITALLAVAFCIGVADPATARASAETSGRVSWTRKSSSTGDMPTPNDGQQQTCCMVLDIDKDGVQDFVVGERTRTPSVVWYKYNGKGWDRFVIDNTRKNPEAGGDFCDVDGDGDLDVILGQDASGDDIWWWENPCPNFSKPWTCRYIKNSDGNKHHDQTFGDFDGDGRPEFVTWNQGAKRLLLFEIPEDPKSTEPWPYNKIYSWSSGRQREGFPCVPVDIDQDGKVDIVGGGRWFKHQGGTNYKENVIDPEMAFTQCAAGQLVKGGWAEVVFSPGDMNGDAKWYEWDGKKWEQHKLRYVVHGHTCEIGDIDQDGNLDILIGEMGQPGAGDDAKIFIWYGDGKGHFKETVACHGQGIHEGKLADLDGDGDLDILLKPYHHNSPRIDVLLNDGKGAPTAKEAGWQILFDGEDLSKWQNSSGGPPGKGWVIQKGVLTRKPKAGMIWTKQRFVDFTLELDFKAEGNSGLFFRTDNPQDCVQTGLEMQILRPIKNPGKHSCGAIYDALAPSKEMTKDDQWNHVVITAVDNKVTIVLNGEQIIDMDLNRWTEPHKNPDGSKNKFRAALKNFKREGHIGFQDHGHNVWFRNIRIKPL